MVKLKVYYGWSKINAVRKKRSLSVVFENSLECRSQRGQRCLSSIQTTCYERYQTEEEAKDGLKQNRIFTGYDLMFDENRNQQVRYFRAVDRGTKRCRKPEHVFLGLFPVVIDASVNQDE